MARDGLSVIHVVLRNFACGLGTTGKAQMVY